ncbi:MAG: hypothetical protein Q4P18_02580 [Methanobrevibacter sp.]|uniref:hypothetical protein n=1 Tax=Methanobrevibacter sp. TaxID=66852 RepID=UPI0026E089DC|nr:hypothetical protein [Methanobrevibacter sp.]MDO5848398.1 hypothetical protein [Methanobrevibacter sp.]
MNHAKIVLVACISAFVAITTAFLGVTGTILGSVLSSVLYNVLSEILEKPVTQRTKRTFSFNFEYEIAYVFPLIVIAFIQLLLLAAFLSQWGYLPGTFLNAYLKIQGAVDNNLYRILGFALVVMGVYPFIIRPNIVKKSYGLLVAFIGLIFLARGFVDSNTFFSQLYDGIFRHFDFSIEVFAFLLLVAVILLILKNASVIHKEFKNSNGDNFGKEDVKRFKVRNSKLQYDDLDDLSLREVPSRRTNHYNDFEEDYIPNNRIRRNYEDNSYHGRKPNAPRNYYGESQNQSGMRAPKNNNFKGKGPNIDINEDRIPAPRRNPLNNENRRKRY